MLVAGFVALILNPLVVALQRWRIRRRGWAVAVVTLWAVLVFAGLAVAFGYPLTNGITHLSQRLPSYVNAAEHGTGWIGHLARRYHVLSWVQHNTPKLVSFGQGLAKPALTLGKGALSLLLALLTIFILVLLLLLEGPKLRTGVLGLMSPARAERYSRVAREVNRSVTGYMLGNILTSVIAGAVVLVTLLLVGVPFPFLWALWVALVDFLPMVGGALAGIPTVLFALGHSLSAGDHHPGGLPRLHPDRESRAEPAGDEPDGQGQSAARADVHPGRGVDRRLGGRGLRRLRRGVARHPRRGRDPGAGPGDLDRHRPAAARRGYRPGSPGSGPVGSGPASPSGSGPPRSGPPATAGSG